MQISEQLSSKWVRRALTPISVSSNKEEADLAPCSPLFLRFSGETQQEELPLTLDEISELGPKTSTTPSISGRSLDPCWNTIPLASSVVYFVAWMVSSVDSERDDATAAWKVRTHIRHLQPCHSYHFVVVHNFDKTKATEGLKVVIITF